MSKDDLPGTKECSRPECDRAGQQIPREDFYVTKRKLKYGGVAYSLKGECKRCTKRLTKERANEMGREAWIQRIRAYNAARGPGLRNRYQRKWWRKNVGQGKYVWKKYFDEVEAPWGEDNEIIWLDPGPLVAFLIRVKEEYNFGEIEEDCGLSKSFLNALITGKQRTVKLEDVDAILFRMGHPLLVTVLYPTEGSVS